MRKYYVGLDVHKLTIAIAVLDAHGKFVSRTVIQTSTEAVREFFQHLGGEIHLTFEEGNHSAWLGQAAGQASGGLQSAAQPNLEVFAP